MLWRLLYCAKDLLQLQKPFNHNPYSRKNKTVTKYIKIRINFKQSSGRRPYSLLDNKSKESVEHWTETKTKQEKYQRTLRQPSAVPSISFYVIFVCINCIYICRCKASPSNWNCPAHLICKSWAYHMVYSVYRLSLFKTTWPLVWGSLMITFNLCPRWFNQREFLTRF